MTPENEDNPRSKDDLKNEYNLKKEAKVDNEDECVLIFLWVKLFSKRFSNTV